LLQSLDPLQLPVAFFLEGDVGFPALVGYCLEIEPRGIGHIRRDLIDRESLRGLSDKRPELRRIIAIGIGEGYGGYYIRFNSCAKVSLDPLVLFLQTVLRAVVCVKGGCTKSR
jgi:hypothetical protein